MNISRISAATFGLALVSAFAQSSSAFAGPVSASTGPQESIEVNWKGKPFDAGSPPTELPESARAAVAEWKTWAKRSGYRMDLDAPGRVLVLSAPKGKSAQDTLQIVSATETWFDAVCPSVKGSAPKVADAKSPAAKSAPNKPAPQKPGAKAPPKTADPIPEDPESAPPVLAGKGAKATKTGASGSKETAAGGAGSSAPDARTVVFLALGDEKDQESVLAFLGETHPDLKDWSSKAGRDPGFVIENPLAGAYVQIAKDQEEWNPEHEIVNRVVRLLTLNRFGQLPNWLVHGIAWEAETARDKTIYVYPNRNEFVPVAEHGSWPTELAHEYKDRGAKKPMQIEELTRWNRGTWNGSSARMAFGMCHYLATAKKAAFAGVLADMRTLCDEGNRNAGEDETRTRDPNWAPTAEDQLAILRARCGDNVLADASAWLAQQGTSAGRKSTEPAKASAIPVKD
jgi:hypothetical protein